MRVYPDAGKLFISSWSEDPVEPAAWAQAVNLANHPAAFHHIALMPDCHMGYGMPIGGVAAFKDVVIPNAVGVDIGCGMAARPTNIKVGDLSEEHTKEIVDTVAQEIPRGFSVHKNREYWVGFKDYEWDMQTDNPGWMTADVWSRAQKSLGTLGGGNHFLDLWVDLQGSVWLGIHSGSRCLGAKIADFYNKLAKELNERWFSNIPTTDLAFLPVRSVEGQAYLRDMDLALRFAAENRKRMMGIFSEIAGEVIGNTTFGETINIHHNYAALENHFGKNVWVHRKGATQAKEGQLGIIPGSMGTSSYIVVGKGNRDSFMSCSHGAGRTMSRTQANMTLSLEECNKAMEGIYFRGWGKTRKGGIDLSEAPGAYKPIEEVIKSQLDLIAPQVCLRPLGIVNEV